MNALIFTNWIEMHENERANFLPIRAIRAIYGFIWQGQKAIHAIYPFRGMAVWHDKYGSYGMENLKNQNINPAKRTRFSVRIREQGVIYKMNGLIPKCFQIEFDAVMRFCAVTHFEST